MTIFQDSHHFSRTLGSLWWQSFKTAITSAELWAMFDDNLSRQPSLQQNFRQCLITMFNDSAFFERTLRGRFREKCGRPNHWEEGDPNQGGCHLLVSKMTPMGLFLLYDLEPIQGLTNMLRKIKSWKVCKEKKCILAVYKAAFLYWPRSVGWQRSIWIGGAFGFMAVHDWATLGPCWLHRMPFWETFLFVRRIQKILLLG